MGRTVVTIERVAAEALDAADPLARWRDRFVTPAGLVYLDGNSLGMTPIGALERLQTVAGGEWAEGLIRSWDHWLDLPRRVGDRVAPIIGAAPGSVVVHDSTTVNLYQLVHAGLALAGDGALAVDAGDFPTDRYVVAGIAAATGRQLRTTLDDLDGVAVVVRSAVDYRTAERTDMVAETARAPRRRARSRSGTSPTPPAPSRSTSRRPASTSPSGARTSSCTAARAPRPGRTCGRASPSSSRSGAGSGRPRSSRWATPTSRMATSAGCSSARRASSGSPPPRSASATSPTPGWPLSPPRAGRSPASPSSLCDELGLDSPSPRDDARRGAHVAVRRRRRRRRARHVDPPRRDHRRPATRRDPHRLRRADDPFHRRLGRRARGRGIGRVLTGLRPP